MGKLNHFDEAGNAVMVDVTEKDITTRVAVAIGEITMNQETYEVVKQGRAKKGDVLGVARVAGLTKASIDFELEEETSTIRAICTTKLAGRTGVEMEALTGVMTALLTIYDMCKAMDRSMCIQNVHLLEKLGGKSGHYQAKK